MKTFRIALSCLLLAALPLFTYAQNNPVLVIEYMQVEPGMTGDYLDVEKTFKKIHKMKLEEGLITGWQLWQKQYASEIDDYHYMTINWYKDLAHSLQDIPDGFWDKVYSQLGLEDSFYQKILASRDMVKTEVVNQSFVAENGGGSTFLQVNEMMVKPGKVEEYWQMEWEFSKPLQEKAIEKGYMSHWGVYQTWPYEKGQVRIRTVDGFESLEQLTMTDREDLLSLVHPDISWEEANKKVGEMREIAGVEIWKLVDAVFPEE